MEEPPDGATEDPRNNPNVEAMSRWEEVLADMEATASEYRDQGWDATELHPGDVAMVLPDEQDDPGIDIILPKDEFQALQDHGMEDGGFDTIEAFQAGSPDFVYLLLAIEDTDSKHVVLTPAYYQVTEDARGLFEHAIKQGKIDIFLRTLTGEEIVVSHKNPGLLAPPEFNPEDSTDE
ncbi:MAG: hypothetical protein SV377_05715 [Halobacteria archaeon]|nr:hypothetical protein [Halobacteria archaeon]